MEKIRIGSSDMRLFTEHQIATLKTNGFLYSDNHEAKPCVYLKGKRMSFLISEMYVDKDNALYGLYMENNIATLGIINLDQLLDYHDNKDFLFNDEKFEARYTINIFKSVADEFSKLIFDDITFEDFFEKYKNQ